MNDRQYVEVFPDWKGPEQLILSHVAFETDDNARQMRDYLASKGVKVPDALEPGPGWELEFHDPGPGWPRHRVRGIRPWFASLSQLRKFLRQRGYQSGLFMWGRRCRTEPLYDHLYRDILEFREFWHGGMTDKHRLGGHARSGGHGLV